MAVQSPAGQQESVGRPWPRLTYAVGGMVVTAVCFVLLTVYAGTASRPTAVDLDVQRPFVDDRGSVLTALARTLTYLGSTPELYVVLLAAGLLLRRRTVVPERPSGLLATGPGLRGLRLPLCFLLWLIAGQLLRTLINQLIARPRPPLELHLTSAAGYAFPSGHTTSATIAYGLLAGLVAVHARQRRTVVVAATIAALGAIGVGLSRIYLGVHWPTDVAAGWAFGLFWLLAGYALLAVSTTRASASQS